MALSIADQIALDDALVAPADRLRIGKCNLRLSSDVTSKEATLQVVYDVLKLTPFYKAFQVTADAPEIYMQEFWASAYVHNRSVRFKMNNKKHIIGLEQFRDILQICPRVGNKKSFAAVINKCLCGTPSYDSLRLSQAQILWGMYNKKSVDYAYLLWEDFIFKIENKKETKVAIGTTPVLIHVTTINVILGMKPLSSTGLSCRYKRKHEEANTDASLNGSLHCPQGKDDDDAENMTFIRLLRKKEDDVMTIPMMENDQGRCDANDDDKISDDVDDEELKLKSD
ncbi:hypothetical protein Tco_0548957 [Tanacetum coccineum]